MEESAVHTHADHSAEFHELAVVASMPRASSSVRRGLSCWSFPLALVISISIHALLLVVAWALIPVITGHVLKNPLMVFQEGEQNIGDPMASIDMVLPSMVEVVASAFERPPVDLPETELPDAPPVEMPVRDVQLPPEENTDVDYAPGVVGFSSDTPASMNPYMPRAPVGSASTQPDGVSTLQSAPIRASIYTPPTVARGVAGRRGLRGGLDSRGLPTPDYPAEARRRRQEGVVELQVNVTADGSIENIKVVSEPGFPLLVQAAIDALKNARFDPATRDGMPVPGPLIIPFRFTLD